MNLVDVLPWFASSFGLRLAREIALFAVRLTAILVAFYVCVYFGVAVEYAFFMYIQYWLPAALGVWVILMVGNFIYKRWVRGILHR